MMDNIPIARYAHSKQVNPLEKDIFEVLMKHKEELTLIRDGRYTRSQDIEKCLQDDLKSLGFLRSATAHQVAGLFAAHSDFEVDFFQPEMKIAIEVEKGKHFNLWRNLVKFCESPLIEHGVLVVPYQRHGFDGADFVLVNTLESLKNVETLYDNIRSILCFGY